MALYIYRLLILSCTLGVISFLCCTWGLTYQFKTQLVLQSLVNADIVGFPIFKSSYSCTILSEENGNIRRKNHNGHKCNLRISWEIREADDQILTVIFILWNYGETICLTLITLKSWIISLSLSLSCKGMYIFSRS